MDEVLDTKVRKGVIIIPLLLVAFAGWFLVPWSIEGVAVQLGRDHGAGNLRKVSATITQTETIPGKASAQDGGYTYTAGCRLHLSTTEGPRVVAMPCATFTEFESGHHATLTMWHDIVIEVVDQGDPVETSWGWNGGRMMFALFAYPLFLAGLLAATLHALTRLLRPRKVKIAGSVVLGVLSGLITMITMGLVPFFKNDPTNPWWPVAATAIAFLVADLFYIGRNLRK